MSAALSLFDEMADSIEFCPAGDRLTIVVGDIELVDGLLFLPQFITAGEERVLLWQADRDGEWSSHWSRRTKSFGSSYVRGKGIDEEWKPGNAIPTWSDAVRLRLVEQGIVSRLPNQMGINEYMPGQGIAQHVDYFGGTVVSLTLGSGCIMDFTHPADTERTVSVWLPRCSIVVLNGAARNIWRHGIRGRLKDVVDGRIVKRDRRVSLTFRDIVI